MTFHPDVLAAHAQFGGDLESMQKLYEYEELKVTAAILQQNLRDSHYAMCAMRDAINEHVPMPSHDSDLIQGPETSVFCAAVAEAVISALQAKTKMNLHHELITAAKRLIDSVEFDVNGTHGKGGNGGLTSDQSIRAASELRVIISRIEKEKK